MISFLKTPTQEIQDRITLWLNHLLVLYAFLIPINNNAKSSLFFTMLVLFLYRRNYWVYLKEVFSNKIVQAFLLFYLLHAAGMLYTENIEYGKDHMDKVKYLLFPIIFLSFLDIRFAFRILLAFLVGVFVSEVFSYLIHFKILPYQFMIGEYEIWKTRTYSPAPFLAHSDHGVGVSLAAGILLYYVLNFHNVQHNIFKIIAVILILFSLGNLSFIVSRTGYLAFIVVIITVLILSYKNNIKSLFVAFISFFIFCFGLYHNFESVKNRVDSSIVSVEKSLQTGKYAKYGSVTQRIGLSLYSTNIIKDNIFFGVGTGDHMDLLRQAIPKEEKRLKKIAKPHNVYVQMLMQHGIFGLLIFIYMIYTLLSYKNTDLYKKGLIVIITMTTLAFMLGGMLYGTFELPLIVVLISAMIASKQQNFSVKNVDLKLFLQYFVFAILFLVIGITR